MTFNKQIALIILLTFASCNTGLKRRIILDNTTVEGDISSDTIYNGRIRFYDTATNKLVIDANYRKGKLEGKSIQYYLNGKIKNVEYYNNNKILGTATFYDSSGKLASKQDYYYGIKVGSDIAYKNDTVSEYYFSSLDGNDLFSIRYDTITNKGIYKINGNAKFFFHNNLVKGIATNGTTQERIEYFIYLPNPPDFHFQYSLCIVDQKDNTLSVQEKFDMSKSFTTFIIDPNRLKDGERFAIKLSFIRQLNDNYGEKGELFKHL